MNFRKYLLEIKIHGDPDEFYEEKSYLFIYDPPYLFHTDPLLKRVRKNGKICNIPLTKTEKEDIKTGGLSHKGLELLLHTYKVYKLINSRDETVIRGRISLNKQELGIWGHDYAPLEGNRVFQKNKDKCIDALYKYILS